MAVGHGSPSARNLCLTLYIYLSVLSLFLHKDSLTASPSLLVVSEELMASKVPCHRKSEPPTKQGSQSSQLRTGLRLLSNASVSVLLLMLSNDVSSNPGPFSLAQVLPKARGLKISHLNVRSLFPKIDEIRMLLKDQPKQNKAAKLILDRPKYSSATEALEELEWKHLDHRRHLHRCVFIFRCLHNIIDFNFNFRQDNDIHHHNTRQSKNLHLSAPKTNWAKQKLTYQAALDFNLLSPEIQETASILLFKKKLERIS